MSSSRPHWFTYPLCFDGGALTSTACDALTALIETAPGYLEVGTSEVGLRVWPAVAGVHCLRLPRGGVASVSAALAGAFGTRRTVDIGTTTPGETRVAIEPDGDGSPGRALAVDLQTRDRVAANAVFRALARGGAVGGRVAATSGASRPALLAFLRAIGGEVHADLTLSCDDAAALATTIPGELTWSGCDIHVRLPEGEVSTHALAPVPPEVEAGFHNGVRAALGRSGRRSDGTRRAFGSRFGSHEPARASLDSPLSVDGPVGAVAPGDPAGDRAGG